MTTPNAFGVVHDTSVAKFAQNTAQTIGEARRPLVFAALGGAAAGGYLGGRALGDRKRKKTAQARTRVRKVDDPSNPIYAVIPAAAVETHRRSRKNKKEAAATHWAAITGGSAAGTAAGMATGAALGSKVPALRRAGKIGPIAVSAQRKQRIAEYGLATAGSAAGGAAGGEVARRWIKRNKKRYRYSQSKG